ncbi:MAG: sugar phosphate nucleotidyltransferase [Pseudomonadota bacterium]
MVDRAQDDVVAVVMAGGMGARLRPLTDARAKPAVNFAGIHRIIDFTLSNCINSDIRKIHVLTQYKSHPLSNHLKMGWNFLSRRLGQFIDEIPAQMQKGTNWYEGTADAIRQNLSFIAHESPRLVLILAGDHIYKMDYRLLRRFHEATGAAATISVVRVDAAQAAGRYGVVQLGDDGKVRGFDEKPTDPARIPGSNDCFASMGIYLFNFDVLEQVLSSDWADFGQDVFARLVEAGHPVYGFDFSTRNAIQEYQYITRGGQRLKVLSSRASDSDYWRDVGTIPAYWLASLDVVSTSPRFNLYGERWPIFTCPQFFPPAKFVHESPGRVGSAVNSIVSNGVIISGGTVRNSVLGPGLYVHSFALVENSVLLGGTISGGLVFETSVGRHARIRNAIIDKTTIIGEGVQLGYDRAADEARGLTTCDIEGSPDYIVVVPKGAVVS